MIRKTRERNLHSGIAGRAMVAGRPVLSRLMPLTDRP